MLYLTTDAGAENLSRFATAGGTLLVTYWSGIVDQHDHVRLGGYPGAFRDLLGVSAEEFVPLRTGETVRLEGGELDGATADVWTERLTATDAEVVSRYADGPVAGLPALTRRAAGQGAAWYLATRVDSDGTAALVHRLCREAGVAVEDRAGVEVVRRLGATSSYLFVLNHTDREITVPADGVDLLSGSSCEGSVVVAAGGVAVVRT